MEEVKINIDGGYILLAKNIIDDEIWSKPPMYLKVWIWILSKAEYRTDAKHLNRGEVFIDVNEIREACAHNVGYRVVTPTYHEIYRIIEWLKYGEGEDIYEGKYEGNMIVNANVNTKGNTKVKNKKRYKVRNYNVYQTSESYERKHESNNEHKYEKSTNVKRKENLLLDKELKEYKELKELKNTTTPPIENSRQIYAEIAQKLESCGFGVISPYIFEDVIYWSNKLNKDMVIKAIEITNENGVNKWAYTKSILQRWAQANLTTLEQVRAHENKKNYKPNQQHAGLANDMDYKPWGDLTTEKLIEQAKEEVKNMRITPDEEIDF